MILDSRRAVEALRAGVPNRFAVEFLGLGQPAIEARFDALLSTTEREEHEPTPGFIVGGEFGSGKSHVLQGLRDKALNRRFAVSFVTISKETPLSSLEEVYKAAIRGLSLHDRRPGDLNEVATQLRPSSDAYRKFDSALRDRSVAVDPIFPATLLVAEKNRPEEEITDRVWSFWAGARIKIGDVKRHLRLLPDTGIKLGKVPAAAALAPDRFRFTAGLIRAAGYKGWVLLLDEVELIASFPLRGRAKAYAELAWLLGLAEGGVSGLATVATATQEFTGIVLREKQDRVKIPTASWAQRDPAFANRADAALKTVTDERANWERIIPADNDDLDGLHRKIRDIYRRAFDWESRVSDRPAYNDVQRSMRMHVREWITRWDLERLDPSYRANIDLRPSAPDLTEREGLEGFSEHDAGDDEEV